jgi:hypothetical protein
VNWKFVGGDALRAAGLDRRFPLSSIYYLMIYKDSGDSPQCETKYEEKCETKYDTVQEQKCETVYDNKCNTIQEQKCETRYEDKCETKGGQSHRFPSKFRTLSYVKITEGKNQIIIGKFI